MQKNFVDLTGQRFGRLVVVEKDVPRITSGGIYKTMWICKCDCGNVTSCDSQKLRRGHTTSCGCVVHENKGRFKDITGQRFGRLTVIRFLPRAEREHPRRTWLCRCDCGNEIQVAAAKLISGHTTSCGCAVVDHIANVNKKYRHTNKRLYSVWKSMNARCHNPKAFGYKSYGGRGITICDEWSEYNEDGYETFYDWAVDNGYDFDAKVNDCTIDRVDVNGNYEPGNCRWVTNKVQQNNRRDSVKYEYHGESHTMSEWAEILGVKYSRLRYHIRSRGESIEEFARGL